MTNRDNDKSLNAVLSGKNLFNLTQSAVARQNRENYIIQGPFTMGGPESPQNESMNVNTLISNTEPATCKTVGAERLGMPNDSRSVN